MPSVSQVIKSRNRRRNSERSNPALKIGLGLSLALSLAVAIFSLVIFGLSSSITRDLPPVVVFPSLLDSPEGALLQPTRLYDRTGEQVILTLENPVAADRQYLLVGENNNPGDNQFSRYLIDATTAAFDPDFWKHMGYSPDGWSSGTHPTIAQRLVLDMVIGDEPPSIRRNIRERILAEQVTAKYGKAKVLEWYLNSTQYGESIYGADAAARVYFGKSASRLNLPEAAALTAISQIPGINPLIVPQWVKQQQEGVLQAMLKQGLITEEEASAAMEEELKYSTGVEATTNGNAFTKLVLQQLSAELPFDRVRRGGYKIITTLDEDLQGQAECTAKVYLAQLQALADPAGEFNGDSCPAAVLLSPIQSAGGDRYQDVNAELVVLDPRSGQILALVNQGAQHENLVLPSNHTAGTILSPFIYITGFSRGMSPGSLLWDVPHEITPGDSDPTQEITATFHGPVRARLAMLNDYLAATESVFDQVRAENVIQIEKSFGIIPSVPDPVEDVTLDNFYAQENSLLEIISAYAVLANQGNKAGQLAHLDGAISEDGELMPTSILRVIGADGKVWLDWSDSQQRSIISPQLAYLVTQTLSDTTARVLNPVNPDLLENGKSVAIKTGASMDGNDSWAIGYSPELAIGVWMGHSEQETGGISIDMPAGVWKAMMKYAAQKIPPSEFSMPAGISLVQVCDPSGMLISPICPSVVQEFYLQGNEPTQMDNLYQIIQIDRDTGLLATAFTPHNQVEDQMYLVVPPQAETWAKMEGIPLIPASFDSIPAIYSDSEEVQITNPTMSAHLRGQVAITGDAAGDDFSFYRLQVGKGLNPQQWIQLGDDEHNSVNDDLLGTWDTQSMEGIYILQLQVVRQDQRIDRAMVQVVIDNESPEIQILNPVEGSMTTLNAEESLMVQVSASDAQSLERVDFYIDNLLESTLIQPPFIIFWKGQEGAHTLDVKAYDLAGNMDGASVAFTIQEQN